MPGKIIEHTSDLYIKGTGKSLKDAIVEISKIMFLHMGDAKKGDRKIKIKSEGYDSQIMIIEFFSKILSICESELVIPEKIKIEDIDTKKNEINAVLYAKKGNLKNIIKAVTYNSFVYENKEGKVILKVLFDI